MNGMSLIVVYHLSAPVHANSSQMSVCVLVHLASRFEIPTSTLA